jgi:cell division protein FtsI/penicillin-binding protein 2
MRTFYETDMRRRILVLGFVLVAWSAGLAARLVQLQIKDHGRAKAAILGQNQRGGAVEPERGIIYDRNGQILACSLPAVSVYVNPVDGETAADEKRKVTTLRSALGLTDKEASGILDRLRRQEPFTYVKKKIPREEADRVRAMKLAGVGFEATKKRHYPLGSLAAHVLGGVSLYENSKAGVELTYDALLKGREGRQVSYKDNRARSYQIQVIKPAVPGQDLVLTIDATIQYIVEKELSKAVAAHSAAWGTVIVMDPSTGEILALANWPDYDVNAFPGPRNAWMNRAVQLSYEPGSTFKIVAAAAARERGVVDYTDVFDCREGSITLGGLTIRDHARMGLLTFPQVLSESSNVGTVKFALRLSPEEFHAAITGFGFGSRTGIDLPGEVKGRVFPVKDWNRRSSLPHVAIGYELMVTPLQILRAMNVYATGGLAVRPRVARSGGGSPAAPGPIAEEPRRIISDTTARELVARALEKTVEEGTGKAGRLDGYGIAGKTGTAQVYDPVLKTYTSKKYIASFVGFAPVGRPALAMVVILAEPKEGFYYGGQVCAPVFRDIARQILRYLRVPPEKPFGGRTLTADLKTGGRP